MVKSINGQFFNVDTPEGKAEYTVAALKHRKAVREYRRCNSMDTVIITSCNRCNKRGSRR